MPAHNPSVKPSRRLNVFLDGTWNDPMDKTNVWRLSGLIDDTDGEGIPQLTYYDTGVGTQWHTKLVGGLLGYGITRSIVDAYRWLVDNYDDAAHIFVFGFSRGAFSARSLIGLIAKCGLLRPDAAMSIEDIFERYRQHRNMTPIHDLRFKKERTLDDEWLLLNSRRVPIEFTGIWDTVGSLGIPFGNIPGISRKRNQFHNTRLSSLFKHGAHALALDEHRQAFDATLWTNFIPINPKTGKIIEGRLARNHFPNFEQRWFVGAHGNIGGGYRRDLLAQIPLQWIQRKAEDAGLQFKSQTPLLGREHLKGEVADSYREFAWGAYRALKLGRRHFREIGRETRAVDRGFVETVNETIDATVLDRWQKNADYRKESPQLKSWAERYQYDLKAEISEDAISARPSSK